MTEEKDSPGWSTSTKKPTSSSRSNIRGSSRFTLADGLSWKDPAGRTRTEAALDEWIGKRAGSGRMAPRGFPRDNTFT